MLLETHRALPEVVCIGKWLKSLSESELYNAGERIQHDVGEGMDRRLALHNAVYTHSVQRR